MDIDYKELNHYMRDLTGIDLKTLEEKDRLCASIAVDNINKISYFTKRKIEQINNKQALGISFAWDKNIRRKYGIMAKPGKFFKHLNPDLNNEEIKKLVSKWHSITSNFDDTAFKFSLELNIVKYYHRNSYATDKGDLGSSCMRYPNCQDWIEFYSYYNCSLLVLKNKHDKISARAIIWHNVVVSDNVTDIMDRIYTNNYNDRQRFFDYAENNNILHVDDLYQDVIIKRESNFDISNMTYPYLDTFYSMNDDGDLSNSSSGFDIELLSTNGTASGGIGTICEDCGERFNNDIEGIHINNYGVVCDSCAENYSFCEECNEWYDTENMISFNDQWYCEECITDVASQCVECGDWVNNMNIEIVDDEYYCEGCFENNCGICKDCEATFLNDDLTEGYCEYCAEEHTCECCGDIENDLTENDLCGYCNDLKTCEKCGVFDDNIKYSICPNCQDEKTIKT